MPLSTPSGPYGVSTLELELPAREARAFAAEQVRVKGQPALRLQSTLVTLFYPTTSPGAGAKAEASTAGTGWLNSPRLKSIEGLLKYAGISKYLALPVLVPAYSVLFAKLPYAQNAPLAAPQQGTKFPVGVFSHGLGGTRTTYSQYLSSLASHGVVVAAVEHRDGTAPATSVYSRDEAGKESTDTRTYLKVEELELEDGSAIEQMALRRFQLQLRQAEMHEALSLLTRLNAGAEEVEPLLSSHLRSGSTAALRAAKLEEWRGKLEMQDVYAMGHSFGGATCVALTSDASNSNDNSSGSTFKQALTLDPWLEPLLADGAPTPRPQRPLFVINSEHFSVWRSHMRSVRELVARAPTAQPRSRPWLLTLTGTKHTDFSDFPFLIPRLFASKVAPQTCIEAFAQASLAQILSHGGDAAAPASTEGQSQTLAMLRGAEPKLEVREERAEEIEKRDMGEPGVLVVHSLPDAPEKLQGQQAEAKL